MDRDLLSRHAKGLIGTTGCPGGEVQTYLRLGMFEEALASAAEFRDIFGPDNYYVELMDHGLPIESGPGRPAGDRPRLRLPLVATNDLHYTHQSERPRTRCCSAFSRRPPWPTRTGSSSRATATT